METIPGWLIVTCAVSILAAVLIGGVVGYLWARSRFRGEADLAVARATSASQVERAQVDERLLASEAEALRLQSELQRSEQCAAGLRTDLESSRGESARQTERASRVTVLEQEITRLKGEETQRSEELLRVSTSEAQKQQLVTSQANRVADLESAVETLTQAATVATAAREALTRQESEATTSLAGEREAHRLVREELSSKQLALDTANAEVTRLSTELASLRTRADAERDTANEKLQFLETGKTALTDQFRNLATQIFDEKTKRFTEQSELSMGKLLAPLQTQLSEFKGKVEEVYFQEGKDRSALSEQVRQLMELNRSLGQDAANLASALKGSAKTQGSRGELILERVLEASGLRKGFEYYVQDSQATEDGTRLQPDVVIVLPEQRKIVVDAKVSLTAYERCVAASSDEERAESVRQHLDSIRSHVKGLSEKNYHALYGIASLDMVVMFVPIEPAFMLAISSDETMFMDAWQRNVLLVSPSTLLFVVRTIAHLWRQEAQRTNAQDIAKRGAELYDKLVGFVADMQKVGVKLAEARDSYDEAQKKLSTGRGNVIRQAEMLRQLGVKPTKELPTTLIDASIARDDQADPKDGRDGNFALGAPTA